MPHRTASKPVINDSSREVSAPTSYPSLCAGIVRETRNLLAGLVLTAVGLFAGITFVHQRQVGWSNAEQIANVATRLLKAQSADPAHRRLAEVASLSDTVVAAAYLDGDGSTRAVWPGDVSVYESARMVAAAEAIRGSAWLTIDGENVWTRFTSTPLTTSSGRAVVWYRSQGFVGLWLAMTIGFTVAVALLYGRNVRGMSAWLDRRVFHPMRSLVAGNNRAEPTAHGLDGVYTGGWAELEAVAEQLRGLTSELQSADRRGQYLERRSEDRLRASERTYQRRLRHTQAQTLVDPLTKLLNRRFLKNELENIFRAQREAGDDLALVMFDLDDFKQHNDTCGHQAGDTLLRFTGDLLRGSIRNGDHAIRYGGDEFVLIMPGTDVENAVRVVRRIVALFGQFASRHAGPSRVSISAGIATRLSGRVNSGRELLRQADAALYRVKRAGKNAVGVSSG